MNKILNNDDEHYYLGLDEIVQFNMPIYIDNCLLSTMPDISENNWKTNSLSYQLGDLKRPQNIPKSLVRKCRIHTENRLEIFESEQNVSVSKSIFLEYKTFNTHLSNCFKRLNNNKNSLGGKNNKKLDELKKLVYKSNDLKDCLSYKSKDVSIEEKKNIEQLTRHLINKKMHFSSDGRYVKRIDSIHKDTSYSDAEIVSTAIVKSMGYKSNESIILTLDMDVVNIARNFNCLSNNSFVHVYLPDYQGGPIHRDNYIKTSQVDIEKISKYSPSTSISLS